MYLFVHLFTCTCTYLNIIRPFVSSLTQSSPIQEDITISTKQVPDSASHVKWQVTCVDSKNPIKKKDSAQVCVMYSLYVQLEKIGLEHRHNISLNAKLNADF